MKKLQSNIKRASTLMLALIIFMVGYFTYAVYFYGTIWFNNPNNPRLNAEANHIIMGALADRNGEKLSWSDTIGSRHYAEDYAVRVGSAHLIGDSYGFTSAGMEKTFARYLLGFNAGVLDQLMNTISGQERRGDDVALTVSAKLQSAAFNALAGQAGAVTVMNYKTGEVLCSVSSPGFDVEYLTEEEAANAAEGTFVNRVLQGMYPPGSIFKVVTAAALIDNGLAGETFFCTGETEVDGHTVRCYGGMAHGEVDLSGAVIHSCNGAFATWAQDLGADKLYATAENFGFNDEFLFRDAVVYDSQFVYAEDSFELAWAAVGQSETLLTPMHAAMIASAIANEGVMMEPRLMKNAVSTTGRAYAQTAPRTYRRALGEETAAALKQMMYDTVSYGTATGVIIDGVDICGKTGTAEVGGDKAPHSWFIGFMDEADMPYAICVVVDNSGSGGGVATPIARQVLSACIDM